MTRVDYIRIFARIALVSSLFLAPHAQAGWGLGTFVDFVQEHLPFHRLAQQAPVSDSARAARATCPPTARPGSGDVRCHQATPAGSSSSRR